MSNSNLKGRLLRPVKRSLKYMRGPRLNQRALQSHFDRLGLRRGGILLTHCSLSSTGHIVGGGDALINALLDYLGPQGTLVFPTHTWYAVNRGVRQFDVRETPSMVGQVTELFRRRADAVRSLHPSHSLCAVGPEASALMAHHLDANTPCGEGTPYDKIIQRQGQCLLFGVGLRRLTVFHTLEALAQVPYLHRAGPDRFTIVDQRGCSHEVDVLCHAPAKPSRFDQMEDALLACGCIRRQSIGLGESLCVELDQLKSLMLPVLRQYPDFLLDSSTTPVSVLEDFSRCYRNA